MAARFSHARHHSGCCAFGTAASADLRISPIMDTVVILAVSIFVCLLPLVVVGS